MHKISLAGVACVWFVWCGARPALAQTAEKTDLQEYADLMNQDEAGDPAQAAPPAAATVERESRSVMVQAPPEEDVTSVELIHSDRLRWHIPDPTIHRSFAQDQLAAATRESDRDWWRRLLDRVADINGRPQVELTLADVMNRTMAHSLDIRISGYNPTIDTTRIVEAEAQFDAAFFYNLTKNKQNRPTANTLIGSNVDTLDMTGGIGKLLPTGMQASVTQNLQRLSNDFAFQQINPQWTSAFAVELRQPLLKGFGIDFNRSLIRIAQYDRATSKEAFRRQVITTLRDVEEAYWNLFMARREVVIAARLLSDFQQIYDYLERRSQFDAYRIQIAETKARLERTKATFVQTVNNVRDAEDRLISLMNDPSLDLASDIELIPVDFPARVPVVLDRLTEAQIALDNRPELKEADLGIKRAVINVDRSKNQALPQFDTTFRYTVDGLGTSAHNAFSEVTKNDYHEYFVGIEFRWPIGNRGPRAALRRARLQHAQSMAALKKAFESVIFDVNVQVRRVQSTYDQILPNYTSVEASEEQVGAIRDRAETKNFVQLNSELNALQDLAASRRRLMESLVDYQMANVELERSKGTLPEFNGIFFVDEADDLDRMGE